VFIHSQKNILFEHIDRVPNAGSWETLLFDLKDRFQFEAIVLCLSFLLFSTSDNVVLCHLHVFTNRKKS